MQQLKKYHIEEVNKIEKTSRAKYKQVRGLVDQYRVQVAQFEKITKQNEQYIQIKTPAKGYAP